MQMSKFKWISISSEFSAGFLKRKLRKKVRKLEVIFQAYFGHAGLSAVLHNGGDIKIV